MLRFPPCSRRAFLQRMAGAAGTIAFAHPSVAAAPELAASSGPSSAIPRKLVFAHFMTSATAYPPFPPPTVAERIASYRKEIRLAQSKGIDGFVINTGVWDENHQGYAEAMYEAARQAHSGFKLFFSIDFNLTTWFDVDRPGAPGAALDIVTRFHKHPCQFRIGEKSVVSTFYGSQKTRDYWESDFIGALAARGVQIVFVPNFYRYKKVMDPPADRDFVAGIYEDYPFIDGLFFFGSAVVPADAIKVNSIYGQVARERGKIYMASVSPTYSPLVRTNNRLFDYRGGEGLCKVWEGIIRDDPPWVEIVTWNDYGEQHYVGPAESGIDNTLRYPHLAWLELCEHYIKWYKRGSQPAIGADRAFYFYRSHSKNAEIPNPPLPKPDHWETVSDSIYVTTMLTEAARLEIRSGEESYELDAPAGLSHHSRPFGEGTQRIRLTRGGNTILESTGAMRIDNSIQTYNFNYYSIFAGDGLGGA